MKQEVNINNRKEAPALLYGVNWLKFIVPVIFICSYNLYVILYFSKISFDCFATFREHAVGKIILNVNEYFKGELSRDESSCAAT